ncbi:hypothetical protein BV22DRAFT_383914 [Leucogyrophana mollusca]|uniref:Uncharacterized protein n=1 Tax=Leucogyrophana mollusca TaxID=85980 RepID=A0ACB8BLF4_9AGAM|nr:hypothetical protein BV22DRAFT_383914 [Leucogyrophana mollusca]
MPSIFPLVFIFVIVLGLMACGFLFVPKGPQQTVIRTAIMLTLASCYLMWMVTYLAQLHPLSTASVPAGDMTSSDAREHMLLIRSIYQFCNMYQIT